LSCSSCFINTTSSQNRYSMSGQQRTALTGITYRAYSFGIPYMSITFRPPEDLDGDHLTVVPSLPNFGLLGAALGMVSLLRNAFELIWCWDCTIIPAQSQKFNFLLSPRPWDPTGELLRWGWMRMGGRDIGLHYLGNFIDSPLGRLGDGLLLVGIRL